MIIKKYIPIFLIIIAFVIGVYFYPSMPEKMASHWNVQGQVDGYISKFWGIFLFPGVITFIYILFLIIPKIDPLRHNVQKFRNYFDNFIIIILLFYLYLYLATIFWNVGYEFNMSYIIFPGLAILFYYIGILLENAKRNWFIGIRTPWTLSSDKVWEKTHKIGSKLFKLYALIVLLSIFLVSLMPNITFWFIIIPILGITLYLFVYSYFEYKKEEKRK